jgi:molybdate transport system substrate-binding protein
VRRVALAVAAALTLLALLGAADAPRITVLAAASLTDALPKLDKTPRYSFAGSDQLAFQIRQGAPADVFAAASPKHPQQLYAEGLVAKPVTFATNALVLIVPRGNPAAIRSVYDLRRPGIKLVIGEQGVPIGDYTRTVLSRLGLDDALANVVSEESDVKLIAGKVALGDADAGFVYRTEARPLRAKVIAIAVPAQAQPLIEYQIAVVTGSRHQAEARAFVRLLLGARGRAALEAAGFGLP